MVEKIAFENVRIFNFEGVVTLTLTLHQVILHTIVHHLSTSTYMPSSFKSKKLFVDKWAYVRTDGRTFETSFIRLTL